MTDVVKIAKKRRAKMVAEIARLDEFLGMAEKLIAYERQAGAAQPQAGSASPDDETSTPASPPDARKDSDSASNGAGTSA